MIRTTKALWQRSCEIVRENVPEPFLDYPYAEDLGIGWYPSRLVFQDDCSELLYKALPDTTGAVFPYHHDFNILSHLIIKPYDEFGKLDGKRRSLLPAMGKKNRRQAGILGIGRLRTKKPCLLITDDELLVCRQPDAIAMPFLSTHILDLIQYCTPNVQLKSTDPSWINRMAAIAKGGINVTVGDASLVEHLVSVITELFREDLGLASLSHRIADLLENVVPLERMAIIQTLKQRSNIDLSHVLPDDFHVFRREGDFYEAVELELGKKIESVSFDLPGGLILDLLDGRRLQTPMELVGLGAVISAIMGAKLDLVDWAYNTLKELPHFYLYRDSQQLETRSRIADKVGAVVLAVLCRMAAGRIA